MQLRGVKQTEKNKAKESPHCAARVFQDVFEDATVIILLIRSAREQNIHEIKNMQV